MQSVNRTNTFPSWLDSETRDLIKDVIAVLSERHPDLLVVILYGSVARHEERPLDMPDPSDVDLLAILDSDDPHVDLHQGDALSFPWPGVYPSPGRATRGTSAVCFTHFAGVGPHLHRQCSP